MKRLVAMVVAAGAALAAVAMPTKAELQKAQTMVTDVTAADVAALKAKSKTPADVAAKHMELAAQAGNEAEKYVLLQGAFKLYAKAGDYEGAANALGTMNREITDMNPEVIVEIYNKAIFSSMKEKAPKLHAIKEAARRQASYRKQLAKAEAAVKANPKDPVAQKKLGECYAELGDWSKALDAFALAGGALAKTAAAEKDGTAAPQVSGDFWWDYESGDEISTYKLHAAELYRKALADDSFKGLARTRTEQRIKEVDKVAVDLPHSSSVAPVALDATSLAHRWSFTKDFMDGVGKIEAKKIGKSVELKDGQCVMEKGGLEIDDVLPKDGNPFTVELWYTETERRKGGYVVDLRANPYVGWVTGAGREGYFIANGKTPARGLQEMNFELNHKYLLAITYDGRELITAYKFDLSGKGSLLSYPISDKLRHVSGQVRLGGHCESKKYGNGIFARFDEIRIWRVCKSREDIEATIKAGPDRVVMPKEKRAPTRAPVENVSSAKAHGGGTAAKNGACEFKGVLPSIQHVLLWKNVSLKEINQLQAGLCGSFIPNGRVQSCYMKENGTRKTFQFQAIDGRHIKCVGVELVQKDGDVYGRIVYARHTKYASKEVDFDLNPGGKMDIAKTETDIGYAVKELSIIDVKAEGNGDADAKKTEAMGSGACYPREDFGGVLLSSKYEIVESSGKLSFENYRDGLFNCQKSGSSLMDFAFQVCAKEKEVSFTLKLLEPVTLAGLLIVNRKVFDPQRQVPLCVWASEDRVKWECIFIDESVRDEYRIDLSNKNITCKYLRFGRLPGVNNEPFHLARTLVYVKSSAAEKKAKK